jgi:hypothetical protein
MIYNTTNVKRREKIKQIKLDRDSKITPHHDNGFSVRLLYFSPPVI